LWETLGSDITAASTTASGTDPGFGGVPQRFYRILLMR
jgi:hypothetical protein